MLRFLKAFRDPWVVVQFAWFALVLAGIPLLARRLPPAAGGGAALRLAGVVAAVLGAVVLVRGGTTLGANLVPTVRPRRDATLVTHGIYALVRHPIYLGATLLLFAWAARPGHLAPALAVFGTSLLFFTLKARAEERLLLDRFPDYAAYQRRVGMLLPRLRAAR
ncbi:MAG: isoprenylcysteine carboxylmethyltransferase family protein [Gemmatimonadales bacterium]|nr:isoprenylcysteine carboxylmethyltransferase family protein [Gemmatimonadales bacterium]